jgi:hypothetical protein
VAGRSILLWCARFVWLVLPVATGSAFGDALASWSTAPARVATVLLWLAWGVGLLALFAPRPWGLTALRIVAPLGVIATIATITSTSSGAATIALTNAMLAAILALASPVNEACANALAYGDEWRAPLHVPTPLLIAPVPLGILLVGVGAASGPLLLADGRFIVGAIAFVLGMIVAFACVRSLHALSRRWLVVVPAGLTIADPLTLADPVLMRRETITAVRRVSLALPADTLDLRLGTTAGALEIELTEPAAFARRRGRAGGEAVEATGIAVAVVRPVALLELVAARRIPTG